jgi:hypothetical protein
MPRSGRPKSVLVLTDDERDQLQRWARRRSSAQALALRSRIVLACAQGLHNKVGNRRIGINVWIRAHTAKDLGPTSHTASIRITHQHLGDTP